jgi:LysR family transcriptional regulator, hydrogen peroxide-inducible genes activator
MTLTELKYIVAVARERHFGRAATACFVSQPTLSQAIKKLEDELDVKLFERSSGEVTMTTMGSELVAQAQQMLDLAEQFKETAKRGKDPLSGPLRVGVIYTIGPYLLPKLVRQAMQRIPQMPLILQEHFTAKLLDMLRSGEVDCAIIAEPFPDMGLALAPLYEEPFVVALPKGHYLAKHSAVSPKQLQSEHVLLLGSGHCFRDHVLEVCPEFAPFAPITTRSDSLRKGFEGSSLETIRHMVAAGLGVTLLPRLSVPNPDLADQEDGLLAYRPIALDEHTTRMPSRRVVLVWRRSFTRYEAIAALRNAVHACQLQGVQML